MLDNHAALMRTLTRAFDAGDEKAFEEALDCTLVSRSPALQSRLHGLAMELQRALRRCSEDPSLAALTEREVPDARHRLQHVIYMTDDAAHRTLEHVERCSPIAAGLGTAATRLLEACEVGAPGAACAAPGADGMPHVVEFLAVVKRASDEIGGHLTEVLLAQGYQDLTGQILRRLIDLVGDVESALTLLVRLGAARNSEDLPNELFDVLARRRQQRDAHGFGPRAPPPERTGAPAGELHDLIADLGI